MSGPGAYSASIDAPRLWEDLMALGQLTEPGKPYTRRSFTGLFDQGRAFLRQRMLEAGLKVRVDAAGNLIGRLDGLEPGLGAILLGSHSDTVAAGGRFDGVAGVVAALEVVRTLAKSAERLRHSVEVVDFLAEEPSEFGLSCIGSRGMAGLLEPGMLNMTDPEGRRLECALRAVDGAPERLAEARRADVAAFLELHIEQGPVLEAEGVDIGVVTGIVGIRRIEITFDGQAAHAGTAPMHRRRDAAFAGAATIVQVRERAEALARESSDYFVATVGSVRVEPGGPNVVPGRCRLIIDARSSSRALTDRFVEGLDHDSLAAARRADVDRSAFDILSDGLPALCAPGIQDAIAAAADRLQLTAMTIASGAGHDAAFIARICPVGMIFIPCLKGMSHTPDEWSEPKDVAAGTAVMLETVRALDRQLDPRPALARERGRL